MAGCEARRPSGVEDRRPVGARESNDAFSLGTVQARRGLQEEDLDRELESGNRTVGFGESGEKMGQDQCRRSARRFDRRHGERVPVRQGGADMALRRVEPRPDALPSAIRQAAVEGADRGLHGAGDCLLKEVPQPTGRHLQPTNIVGEPDADRPPATRTSIAMTAKDPMRAKHDSSALVETLQGTMPNQVDNHLAVWTGSQLEFPGDLDPFRLVAIKPMRFAHVPIPREIRRFYQRTNFGGGGV